MADTKLPIKKLSDASGKYYPVVATDCVLCSESIVVKSDIGEYKKNDIIAKNTSVKEIITKLCNGNGNDSSLSSTSTRSVQNKVIKAAIDKKVDSQIGGSKIWNEESGGGAMYTSDATGITSFIGVNNPALIGTVNGICGQLYVVKGNDKTKLNMYNGKFCYVKGDNPSDEDNKAKRELLVKEDITDLVSQLTQLQQKYDLLEQRVAALEAQ